MLSVARSLRGLMLLSGLILMAHTLVPHVHGAHLNAGQVTNLNADQEAQTHWLDVLSNLVGADMGEDHLEHFSPEKTVDFSLDVPAPLPVLLPALFLERALSQKVIAIELVSLGNPVVPIIEEAYLYSVALRGPPVMVS